MKKITMICDRCGEEFVLNGYKDDRTVVLSRFTKGFPGIGEAYDLCPDCYKEFYGWWKQENVTYKDIDRVVCQLDCDKCMDSVTLLREIRDLFDEKGENDNG